MFNYISQAQNYAKNGQFEEAVVALRRSYAHAKTYEEVLARAKVAPVPYTCKLFDKLTFSTDDLIRSGTSTPTEDFLEYLTWKDFDPLRGREDFAELTKLKATHGRP